MKKLFVPNLCVVVAAMLGGCADEPDAVAPLRPVIAVKVEPPVTEIRRTFSGLTQAETNSALSFLIGGRIEKLPVRVGMTVKQTQVIAELDPIDLRLQLEQSEAQVRSAEAQKRSAEAQLQSSKSQLTKAKEDFSRISVLYEKDSVPKAQYDGAVAGLEAAQASMKSASAAIDAANAGIESANKSKQLAEQQLGYTVLRAPQDGTIGQVPVEVNQVTQAGATVATLVSRESIQVEIGVPEALIGGVQPGMKGTLKLDSLPKRNFAVQVSKVSVLASQTSTYQVTLRLLQNDPVVRPGMAGEVEMLFPVPPDEQFSVIPATAVAGIQEQRFVWIYDAGVVRRREVTPGGLMSEGIQIRSGLKAGEMVVTRGVNRLTDGMRVKLLADTE